MSRKSMRASSMEAAANLLLQKPVELKSTTARKGALLILGERFTCPAAVVMIPEFSCVSKELIRQKVNELKVFPGIVSTAKTFCDEWDASLVAGVEATAGGLDETTERPSEPDLGPTRSLQERKVDWMMCASLAMEADRRSGKMSHGKKGTWMLAANKLHGEDAQAGYLAVARHVKAGHAGEPPQARGRPPDFPEKVMTELIQFVGMLRAMKSPVYARAAAPPPRRRRAADPSYFIIWKFNTIKRNFLLYLR